MVRKTTTSAAVKDRWNKKHYDRIMITVPIGGREEIAAAAAARGMSISAYIRALIIRDNAEDSTKIIRGGGIADNWENLRRAALDRIGL